MKKLGFVSLSSLSVVPLLLCATPAHAQSTPDLVCSPSVDESVVRPGDSFTLFPNCEDRTTGEPITEGRVRWQYVDESGLRHFADLPLRCEVAYSHGDTPLPYSCGGLLVEASNQPGVRTYYLTHVDMGGYGGSIDLNEDGAYPSVTVTVAADTQASLSQLSTPLLTVQTERVRSQLTQAEPRMRTLRAGPNEQRTGFYVGGLVDYLRQKSDPNAFKSRATQVSFGGDHRFSDAWVAGASLGFSEGRVTFADSASRQESDGTNVTAYASYSLSPTTYLTATLSIESTRFDLTRDEQGALTTATPRGRGVGFSLSAGRDYVFGPWTVAPYVRVDNVNSQVNAFSESGGLTAVAVSRQRLRSNSLNIGAQTQFAVPTTWGIVLPFVRAELTHRRDGMRQLPTATLLDDNSTLLLPTSADTRDGYGTVGFGVSGVHTDGINWFADFETAIGQKGYQSRRLGFGLRSEF